jgi:hypothetical protein
MAGSKTRDEELLEEFRELTQSTMAEQLRLLQRAKELGVGADAWPGARAAMTRAGDLLFELARASVKNYEQWIKLSARSLEYVAQSIYGHSPGAEPFTRAPAQLAVKASGPVGGRATARFEVVNPFPREVEVAFTVPALRRLGDHRALPSDVRFTRAHEDRKSAADHLKISANECGRFELYVDLGSHCEEGTYRGDAHVLLDDTVLGRLQLEVEALPATTGVRRKAERSGTAYVIDFAVQNRGNHTAPVSYTLLDLSGGGGTYPTHLALTWDDGGRFEPGKGELPTLAAGEQRKFGLEIKPSNGKKSFKPGTYTGEMHILVGDQVALRLHVDVDARS